MPNKLKPNYQESTYNSEEQARIEIHSIIRKHIPAIDFSKQVNRKSYTIQEGCISESKVINTQKEVRGLIPMAKQLARSQSPTGLYLPEYKVNYKLILPRIQLKVNYNKEVKDVNEKYKRRIPLIKPYNYTKQLPKLLLN